MPIVRIQKAAPLGWRFVSSLNLWLLLSALLLVMSSCTRQGSVPDKDPVTEVNVPRPTNNIQEHIPPERR